MTGPYDTPQAFRAALQARLRNVARQRGTDLQRLQRRVAFERLLARLFAGQDPPWLLKGGYALELRLPDRARSTLDLDLSVPEPERLLSLPSGDQAARRDAEIHQHLQIAAERDLDDGFQFLVWLPKRTAMPGGGIRCSAEARLAGRVFARFHVDVGLGDVVLDPPEWVTGSDILGFAGIPAAQVALYPVAQQFAEEIHAHTRGYRLARAASGRYQRCRFDTFPCQIIMDVKVDWLWSEASEIAPVTGKQVENMPRRRRKGKEKWQPKRARRNDGKAQTKRSERFAPMLNT